MLIKLAGGQVYYDLTGPENGQVVCFTHSLASDGGMWAEQLPPLLAAGYRVLRLDMRGHGGSDPVAGDYTMEQLADDVAGSLDFLGITRVQFIGLSIGGMLGQAFAIKYGQRLISAPAGNKRIAELIPGGRYQEIATARHFPNVEQAETFNR